MFPAPPTAALASQPRKGIGARVAGGFSRLGAALRSVVGGGPRRPQSGSESRTIPDADGPPAARQARAPRQPGRARKGRLARLFHRRRALAAVPEQSREPADLDFTAEAFPGLTPEARAFFNTPLEDCDPEVLGVVLEALAELIKGAMEPHEGMRDVQDVFLALSSRMAAVSGGAGHAPPTAPPDGPPRRRIRPPIPPPSAQNRRYRPRYRRDRPRYRRHRPRHRDRPRNRRDRPRRSVGPILRPSAAAPRPGAAPGPCRTAIRAD